MKLDAPCNPVDHDTQNHRVIPYETIRHIAALVVATLGLLLAIPDVWNDFSL